MLVAVAERFIDPAVRNCLSRTCLSLRRYFEGTSLNLFESGGDGVDSMRLMCHAEKEPTFSKPHLVTALSKYFAIRLTALPLRSMFLSISKLPTRSTTYFGSPHLDRGRHGMQLNFLRHCAHQPPGERAGKCGRFSGKID